MFDAYEKNLEQEMALQSSNVAKITPLEEKP
jgi:hypothetical protein